MVRRAMLLRPRVEPMRLIQAMGRRRKRPKLPRLMNQLEKTSKVRSPGIMMRPLSQRSTMAASPVTGLMTERVARTEQRLVVTGLIQALSLGRSPNQNQNQNQNQIDPACDLDFDGEASEACGGTDCDDTRGDVGTGSAEICDFVDNNCNTEVNELLDCAVYAVSDNELLKIDPFFATVDVVAQTPRTYFDIDTDSSGRLFAISGGSLTGGLYEYDASDDAWSLIGRINPEFESPNGLAITDDGQLLATGMEHLYVLSPTSGFASTIDSYRNASGEGIVSSGDCVVSKENGVFMTSSVAGSNSDQLVRLTPSSAVGEVIGDIGFGRVWGLSSIGGRLFGFTHQTVNSGSVVMIDGETGEGTFLFDIPYGIYGAASRAER